MNGLLILSPPPELHKAQAEQKAAASASMLEQNFLKEADLGNVLADQQKEIFKSKLAQNILEQEFLNNLLTLLNDQLNENLLKTADGLLPDYKATSGVKVSIDDLSVELCRSDGSNRQCVSVNKGESSTIIQNQGNVTIKNRVNSGNGTLITLKQN
jgi:hypothetical protein